MDALNEFVDRYTEQNTRFVTISPQTSDKNRELIESNKLNFEILFDKDNQYARQLDIVHGFNDGLKTIYGTFGIDVGSANGNSVWELPLPSRIVIGQDHVIKSIDYNADYKIRPEPEATLAILSQ